MLVLLVNLDILLTIQKLYFKIYVLRSRLQDKFLGTVSKQDGSETLLTSDPSSRMHITQHWKL